MKSAHLILSAGLSSRFGSNKLLAELNGLSVIEHVLRNSATVPFTQKLAVVRPQSELAPVFARYGYDIVRSKDQNAGMGLNLSLGIRALQGVDLVVVSLADMPLVPSGIIERLAEDLLANQLDAVRPEYNGIPGHPVLFAATCFPYLSRLGGTRGASEIFNNPAGRCKRIKVNTPGVVLDIDTPDDLRKIEAVIQLKRA